MANPDPSSSTRLPVSTLEYPWDVLQEREGIRAQARSSKEASGSFNGHFSISEGSKPENRDQNRIEHYVPYNRNRVVVGTRYLNASWVREPLGGHWWIVTQAPKENTFHTFFSLFLQKDSRPPPGLETPDSLGPLPCRLRTLVQLDEKEAYLPPDVGKYKDVPAPKGCQDPDLRVYLVERRDKHKQVNKTGFIESIVKIIKCERLEGGEIKEIGNPTFFTHIFFPNWPEFYALEEKHWGQLLSCMRHVDEVNRNHSNKAHHPDPPIVIHCSAGIGRSVTFAGCSSLQRAEELLSPIESGIKPGLLPESPLGPLLEGLENDKVAKEVDSLLDQRARGVNDFRQLQLMYELLDYAKIQKLKKKMRSERSVGKRIKGLIADRWKRSGRNKATGRT